MRRALAALFVLVPIAAFAAGAAPPDDARLAPGDHERAVSWQGLTRAYLIHVPSAVKNTFPVVLAFHGGATNARLMQRYADLDRVADREGFAVVYPSGTGRLRRILAWDAGTCCGGAHRDGVDDVGMTAALLADLATVLPVDPKRVYATGISNGGMMAYRLACEMADRIAAIAPVAGTMNVDECRPSRAVPVLHFHGTADRHVPFGGGFGDQSIAGVAFASVRKSIDFWRAQGRCADTPIVTEFPDRAGDGTRATRTAWTGCAGGGEVALVTIEGGGHTWPGVPTRLRRGLGVATANLSASEMMWEFFRRHPLP